MRLQVNANNALVAKLDRYAHIMGVSRSALCAMLIVQGVMSLDRSGGVDFTLDDDCVDELRSQLRPDEQEVE